MADNTIDVVINAVTDGFDAGIAKVNEALRFPTLDKEAKNSPIGQLFNTLEKSSDSAIAGLIRGTETWHQATLKVVQDLEIKFAQLFANKLLNATVADALGLENAQVADQGQVLSAQTRNAEIEASDQSAGSMSIGAMATKAIAAIMSDAKQTFAGIFAFLSPTMGPAAIGPAAAGSAVVMAQASGITYAEAGAWNIPGNTLAYLHAGEMVVPQSFASSLRSGSGLGGSGDNYTININAIDTQTGAQFLKNNANQIASIISSQVRNFNSNLPVWKG